jgi:single-stranded-DNA-specific exonuclease
MNRLTKLNRLLPLVAIGTVADCQSIIEPTNRILVKSGLKILQSNQHKIEGLTALLKESGLQDKMDQGYTLNSQDLGFTLSPILNSSGRISHARLSIATMLVGNSTKYIVNKVEENEEYMNQTPTGLAKFLIQTNQDRKQMVKDILGEVEDEAKAQFEDGQKMLWLEGNWNKGIIGLLASRLVNMYNLPVVVISIGDQE